MKERCAEHGGSMSYPRTMGFNLWNRRGEFPPGVCLWCLRPNSEKSTRTHHPRAYHRSCKRMKDMFAYGARPFIDRPGFQTCAKCGCGEAWGWPRVEKFSWGARDSSNDITMELDHRVALSIAAEVAGMAGWIRALLPANLQWLCSNCHRLKTTEDIRTLRALRRPAYERELRQLREPARDPNQLAFNLA